MLEKRAHMLSPTDFPEEGKIIAGEIGETDITEKNEAEKEFPKYQNQKQQRTLSAFFGIIFSQFLNKFRSLSQRGLTEKKEKVAGYLPIPQNNLIEIRHKAGESNLVYRYREGIQDIYQSINDLSIWMFTFSFVDLLWNDLNSIFHSIDHLPESKDKELIRAARNEFRLAYALFDAEELDAVYRLVIRNKAILRGKNNLYNLLLNWSAQVPIDGAKRNRINLVGDIRSKIPNFESRFAGDITIVAPAPKPLPDPSEKEEEEEKKQKEKKKKDKKK